MHTLKWNIYFLFCCGLVKLASFKRKQNKKKKKKKKKQIVYFLNFSITKIKLDIFSNKVDY